VAKRYGQLKTEKRANLEQQALVQFESITTKCGYIFFKGQSANNRISIDGKVYFQFGDLRVETPTHHVIIEAESAGGITNLAKYWYCLTNENLCKQIEKPIILLHIFRQVSEMDYASHLALWDFLRDEMQNVLATHIQANRYTYRSISDLNQALGDFERHLVMK